MMTSADLEKLEKIELCRAEICYAVSVGAKRKAMHRYALAKGEKREDRNRQRDGEGYAIEGACAEFAASKYLRRFWPADYWSRKKTCDIPPDIEIRWTMHFDDGHLLLYDDDNPDSRYVLVIGAIPTYYFLGWVYGRDAMLKNFYGRLKPDRPEMFMIPREILRPITELIAL